MKTDLVSVIMPTYNTGDILRRSIESILNQTYRNLELIITDDKSDDEQTLCILKEYEKRDSRVRVFYLKQNGGAGMARNNSIKHAEGQYIAFCDSDDRWAPDKLEKQISYIKKKGCCLVYSSYLICNQDDDIIGIVKCPRSISFDKLKRDNKIGCLTAVYDTSKYGKFYLPMLRKRQDWGMFLTILSKCRQAYGLEEPLAYYRRRDDSLSHKKTSLVRYNINVYRRILKFSPVKSHMYFFLIFLPSYFAKISKVKYDSWRYTRRS